MFLAAPAHAATVTARDETDIDPHNGETHTRIVEFTAAPGETNRLLVDPYERYGVRLYDPAGITPQGLCRAETPQTVLCPPNGGMIVNVALGDGDDTLSASAPVTRVDAGDGNDTVALAVRAQYQWVAGGPGDDTLTAWSVKGGPGADDLHGHEYDYSDHTAPVVVDLAGGTAGAAGENDRIAPGGSRIIGGAGPDVLRAVGQPATLFGGAGDDVVDGGPAQDYIVGGSGNDAIRGAGGDDFLVGDDGDDRIEGGAGKDTLYGFAGDDVLDGGPGRDAVGGGRGADRLLARDGERDHVECGGSYGMEGDHATLDTRDDDSWCEHVTGARRLVLHGLTPAGVRAAWIVLSCARQRACAARVRVDTGRVVSRVRVPAGRRVRIKVTRVRDPGVAVRIVTPANGVLRATFFGVRR